METSDYGIAEIKRFEGLRLQSYADSAGVLTIGYGHTIGVYHGMTITEEQAEQFLRSDLRTAENAINSLVKVPLDQYQFDALASFIFNVGSGAFKSSTLLEVLNKGKYSEVPRELMRWNKVGSKVLNGLVNRRAAEAAMWARGAKKTGAASGTVKPETTPIVSKENISFAAGIAGTAVPAVSYLDNSSPITWVVAAIILIGFGVGLFLFFKRKRAV